MKKYYFNIVLTLVVLLICLFFISYFSNLRIFNFIVFCVSFLIITFLDTKKAFIYLLSVILILGFAFLTYSAYYSSVFYEQIYFIGNHFLISISLFFYFLIILFSKNFYKEYLKLHQEIAEIKSHEENKEILEYNKFLFQTSFIANSSKRKNEENFILKINCSNKDDIVLGIREKILECIFINFRKKYDIVTQPKENLILVFIHNVCDEKANFVLNRFMNLLKKEIRLDEIYFSYEMDNFENINIEDYIYRELNKEY